MKRRVSALKDLEGAVSWMCRLPKACRQAVGLVWDWEGWCLARASDGWWLVLRITGWGLKPVQHGLGPWSTRDRAHGDYLWLKRRM
jgi:hypothetical protein